MGEVAGFVGRHAPRCGRIVATCSVQEPRGGRGRSRRRIVECNGFGLPTGGLKGSLDMTSLSRRFGAVALALGLVAPVGAAWAQAAPKPSATAPAAATGPIKLELQALQSPWTKICGTDQGNNKQV